MRKMFNKNHRILIGIVFLGFAGLAVSQDYEILERVQSATVQSNSYAVEHHREVAKMLSSGARYRKMIFVNTYIQASNITGAVTTPDGRKAAIGYNDVMEIPAADDPSLITDAKVLVVIPGVWMPANSTVTIEYDVSIKSLLYLTPWVYESRVPIRKNSCTITYPSDMQIKYHGQDDQIQTTKNQLGGREIVTLQSQSRSEVSIAGSYEALADIEKKVTFMPVRCATDRYILSTESWGAVAKWFTEISAFADQWDPSMDVALQPVLAKNKNPEDIAAALYQYIQDNFSYSAIEIGMAGFKPRAAKLTFARKSGDCKDLALLYVALLRKAGIEAYPALVETSSAKLFDVDFAHPGQFDHCIVYLPKVRNGVWVDCTVKKFRLGEVPATLQGRYALVTGGPDQLMQIPEDFMKSALTRFRFDGSLTNDALQVTGSLELPADDSFALFVLGKDHLDSQIEDWVLSPDAPLRDLKATPDSSGRIIRLSYTAPLVSVHPYSEIIVNVLNYAPLDFLNEEVTQGKYFALGDPVHKVVEATIDLGGRKFPFGKIAKSKNGKHLNYRFELSEEQGKLRYLADLYFGNGLLNDSEMSEYQQEMKSLRSDLMRSILVQ
jgi:hypothetical protein